MDRRNATLSSTSISSSSETPASVVNKVAEQFFNWALCQGWVLQEHSIPMISELTRVMEMLITDQSRVCREEASKETSRFKSELAGELLRIIGKLH